MKPQTRRLLLAIGFICLLPAAVRAESFDSGEFGMDCAPWDGTALAFTAHAAGAPRPALEFHVYGSLKWAEQSWQFPEDERMSPGGASLRYCFKGGICEPPASGSVMVQGYPDATVLRYDLILENGVTLQGEAPLTPMERQNSTPCG